MLNQESGSKKTLFYDFRGHALEGGSYAKRDKKGFCTWKMRDYDDKVEKSLSFQRDGMYEQALMNDSKINYILDWTPEESKQTSIFILTL